MPARRTSAPCIAIIGDMVHSRALSARARSAAQTDFAKLVVLLNRRFRRTIASRFVITLGDEFQGLLREPNTANARSGWALGTESFIRPSSPSR